MSDAKAFGFGQFIPGYDFLQQLNKAGQGAALPPFSSWVAPTVSVEEIDKRIEELKAVQFWLEQNGKALAATVQALQVQKMTLSTLKGMNVNLQDFAQAFGAAAPAGNLSNWPMGATQKSAPGQAEAPKPQPAAEAEKAPAAAPHPMAEQAQQWWGALTQQFQQIAHQVLQDPAQKNAMAQAASMASDFTKAAAQTASEMMRQAVDQATSAATAAKKPAAKKPAAQPKAAEKPVAKTAAKATTTRRATAQPTAKAAAPKTTRSAKKA
ncbi:PhaM family polyhydroxyalkanoate granule multifunctional regulatory protein [Comamonas nitrativorans]|uniref:PhaM family polyhydroxyalkanoate granule multifunctional regulatory protein n=1 Tax=Comamonas nitrativorans TaxID=108437 RepID=A0ABV9GTE5_9BURK